MADNKNQATDTREKILCAAESLFMEHGYAATSLRLVTRGLRRYGACGCAEETHEVLLPGLERNRPAARHSPTAGGRSV